MYLFLLYLHLYDTILTLLVIQYNILLYLQYGTIHCTCTYFTLLQLSTVLSTCSTVQYVLYLQYGSILILLLIRYNTNSILIQLLWHNIYSTYISFQYATIQYTTWCCITWHYMTVQFDTLIAWRDITVCYNCISKGK